MDAVTGGLGLPKISREHHRASAGNIASDSKAMCLANEQIGPGRGEELVENPAFPTLYGHMGRVREREQGAGGEREGLGRVPRGRLPLIRLWLLPIHV